MDASEKPASEQAPQPAPLPRKKKRLVFCFDGTWQSLADFPSNVVLLAASVERQTSDGIAQIMHYDEGVGTGEHDKHAGGWVISRP